MAKAELSVLFEKLSGKAGNAVFYQSRGQQRVRARVIPRQPNTAAQLAARSWVAKASFAYRGLSAVEVSEWEAFAQRHLPDCTANTAFIKLAAKFQQIQSYQGTSLPIPVLPPADSFEGDLLTLQVDHVAGGLNLRPDQPNRPDTATEILVQLLPSPNRKPRPKNYKTAAIIVFASTKRVFLPLSPGPYALAYRFVQPSSGQQTPPEWLPPVQVN